MSQWQELATDIANRALKSQQSNARCLTSQELILKFEQADESKTREWIRKLSKFFCRTTSIRDPDILKAILWNLSSDQAFYAINWLAGKELAQYKANELQLPTQRQSFDSILQILDLISEFNQLVICFDELDTDKVSENGLHTSQVIGYLVKDLFEHLNKGVILTAVHPGIWKERIKDGLPPAVSEKMSAQGKPYELQYLDNDSIITLVGHLLEGFYCSKDLIPPNRIYPFNEEELKQICREKPTFRQALQWCKENFRSNLIDSKTLGTPIVIEKKEKDVVLEAFDEEMEEDFKSYWDNNHLIAEALFFSIEKLTGKNIEGVKILGVTDRVKKRRGKDPYLNFKIIGNENHKEVCIGVSVLQYDGGRALGAGFKRLLDKNGNLGLTRGCLVRSSEKPLNAYFKKNYLAPLIHDRGGEFVDLKLEEIKPLLAINNVYKKREIDYGITEEQIQDFVEKSSPERALGIHNPLIKEILSAPSQELPEIQDEPEELVSVPDEEEPEQQINIKGAELDGHQDFFLGDDDTSVDADSIVDLIDSE